jgi:pyruvate dehydrogenase E1 component alpha subunit
MMNFQDGIILPMNIIERFEISKLEILNEDGTCDETLKPSITDSQLREIYELMVLCREFDNIAVNLQREGRIGTYASIKGQEAAQIGSAIALQGSDWIFPSFRESASYIAKGMPLELLYEYWGGDERGNKIPEDINAFVVAIPVGTHIPHAVGFAWAAKMKKKESVVLVYFGDGATSEGDFHEGLNFAGVFKIPIVFLCQNNQWAISVPLKRQTASKTLAQKALAYGFEGIQVDGNDVFAVYKATKEALEKARLGRGPTLIECFTYRMSDHTTSDDASRYRSNEEVVEWSKRDPIDRLRKYMKSINLWNEEYEQKIKIEASEKVNKAVEKAESVDPPEFLDMFQWSYATMTPQLKEQYNKAKESLEGVN